MTESRISQRFATLRASGRKAFVPYLTAGYPDLEGTLELARMLERRGADVLELGVPFTDPIADGPTNQRASQRALDSGVTPRGVLELVSELRRTGFALPIVLFTYANPLLQLGGALGEVDGVLVTDLPPEEAGAHIASCRERGVDTIFLAAPTTPEARIAGIAAASRGFLYYVSSKGVTGARGALPTDLEDQVRRLRRHCDLPICVGFGIADRVSAARVCEVADGFVVGSALGAVIEAELAGSGAVIEAAEAFVAALDPRT